MTAEQSAISRAPFGVSNNAMTGAWRVIIARKPDQARTWYYHSADHPAHAKALKEQAIRWIMA